MKRTHPYHVEIIGPDMFEDWRWHIPSLSIWCEGAYSSKAACVRGAKRRLNNLQQLGYVIR